MLSEFVNIYAPSADCMGSTSCFIAGLVTCALVGALVYVLLLLRVTDKTISLGQILTQSLASDNWTSGTIKHQARDAHVQQPARPAPPCMHRLGKSLNLSRTVKRYQTPHDAASLLKCVIIGQAAHVRFSSSISWVNRQCMLCYAAKRVNNGRCL